MPASTLLPWRIAATCTADYVPYVKFCRMTFAWARVYSCALASALDDRKLLPTIITNNKRSYLPGSMETDGAAATAVANDAAVVSGSSQSPLADLFSASSSSTLGDDLGTSTIAIFVLFGASTFAAVGMFFKTWLLEDYRGACLFVLVATQSFVVWFLLLYYVPGSTQLNSTDSSSLHSSVNLPSCYWSIFHLATGSRSQ